MQVVGRRLPRGGDGVLQLGHGERVTEPVEHQPHRPLVDPDVMELAVKERLVVLLVGKDADRMGEAGGRVHLDLVVRVNHTCTEDDR